MSSENIHMVGNDLALYQVIQQEPLFFAAGIESFLCYTSFVQFIQKIMCVYYVPGTVLGAGTIAVSKQTKIPCEFYTLVGYGRR